MKRKISMAVIRRLPKYHRYLNEMIKQGVERTSSKELSEILGFSASQIRQDFNHFGEFGQQGYGYNVKELCQEISNIIGLNKQYKMIIIGAGNIGSAMANYGFHRLGFQIEAIFDHSKDKIGKEIIGLKVRDINKLESYLVENKTDIALLCIPSDAAQGTAERLMISGVEAIWNFAPVDLVAPDNVIVENVHLVDSLMTMTYLINED